MAIKYKVLIFLQTLIIIASYLYMLALTKPPMGKKKKKTSVEGSGGVHETSYLEEIITSRSSSFHRRIRLKPWVTIIIIIAAIIIFIIVVVIYDDMGEKADPISIKGNLF